MTGLNKNGLVIGEYGRNVVIATGFKRKPKNLKTGPMLQVWILRRDMNPLEAIRSGRDVTICGDCKLGPGAQDGRSCYVRPGDAPLSIYKCYRRGGYSKWNGKDLELFAGRAIRWGAYGDPAFVPLPIIRQINASCRMWTGYTHQWRRPLFQAYRDVFMSSCDTLEDRIQAVLAGWRYFGIGETVLPGETRCPATIERNGAPITDCNRCGLCAGTTKPAKSITVPAHGATGARANQIWTDSIYAALVNAA